MSMPTGTVMPIRDETLEKAKEDLVKQEKQEDKRFQKKVFNMKQKYGRKLVEECGSCFHKIKGNICEIINFPAYEWEKNKYCRCKNHVFKDIKGI